VQRVRLRAPVQTGEVRLSNPRRFNIDVKDTIDLSTKGIDELTERVEAMAREMFFRPFALPTVPKSIRHLVQVEYEGERYRLDDEALEGADPKKFSPVAPSDVVSLSDGDLGQLMSYWTGVEAVYGSSLAKLRINKKEADRRLKRATRIVEASLMGKTNPHTGKRYTDAARREMARIDNNVLDAEEKLAQHEVIAVYAESIYKATNKVKESLNRERMRREMVYSKTGHRGPEHRPRRSSGGIRKPPKKAE